jgi:zinc transporter 2
MTQQHSNDASSSVLRRLHLAAVLCGIFLIVEVIGGTLSGSLAVLSDAAHLVADLTSFGVAILAGHLAQLPSSDQHTYGLRRTESLAALLSMVSLAIVSLGLAYEALRRLFITHDTQVDGPLMSFIAFIGVLVNVILAVVLGEHHVHLPGYDSSCSSSHDHSHGHSHHHGNSCGGHETKKIETHSASHDHAHNSHSSSHHDKSHNNQDDTFSFHKHQCSHDHAHHAALESAEAGHHHHSERTPLIPDHCHETVPETKSPAHHHDNVNLRVRI